ncbi:13547_t:CDS:2, partial [Racocetra persica]
MLRITAVILLDTEEIVTDIENITDTIYKAIVNVDDIDENLESVRFYFKIKVNLDTLINEIPLEIEQDQREHYIANKISKLVEQGDGYDYVYHTKTDNCTIIKLSHKQLHQQPKFTGVTEQVKQYIREHLILKASEIHRGIISKRLEGFENLTVDQ